MRLSRLNLYRPTRTADGQGGFTAALGTARAFWGAVVVHETETRLLYRAGSDVAVEDVVVHESLQYRVLAHSGAVGAPYCTCTLERIERPVTG